MRYCSYSRSLQLRDIINLRIFYFLAFKSFSFKLYTNGLYFFFFFVCVFDFLFFCYFSKASDVLSGSQMELRDLSNEKFQQLSERVDGKTGKAF